jgi:sarcosine oxidase subunit beta
MRILDDADVCIIGGGLVGSNIAYRLSKENKKVILLEKKFLTAGASGATFGLIGFQWFKYDTGMPPLFLDYLKETYEMYKGLTQEIGSDFEYTIEGSIVAIETEAELKQREELVRLFEKNDLDIFLLNKEETLRKEPFVNPHILGSTYCPYEGQINPFKLIYHSIRKAKEHGAKVYAPIKVEGFDLQNGHIRGVFTDQGKIITDSVVNASGSGGASIAKLVGLELPIKMQRGQVLVTEPIPPIITRQVHHIAKLELTPGELPVPVSTEIVQRPSGNLFLGGTRDDLSQYDTGTTTDGINTVATKAVHLIPALENVQVIRSFAGVRHIPLDGYPVLGESEKVEGFFNAILHAAVMLTPVVGQITTDLITKGRSTLPIDDYRLSRYEKEVNL